MERAAVIEKVRKILAKADPTRNDCEAEAASAMQIAKRIMAEHDLEMADVAVSSDDVEGDLEFCEEHCEEQYTGTYVNGIINAIAAITGTQCFRHRHSQYKPYRYTVTFCGTKTDTAVASAMFKMLLGMVKIRAATAAAQQGRKDNLFIASYREGFARGLYESARKKVDLGDAKKNECHALMVINKEQALASWIREEHSDLKSGRRPPRRDVDYSAYHTGKVHGSEVNLAAKACLN